jgi:membrane protein
MRFYNAKIRKFMRRLRELLRRLIREFEEDRCFVLAGAVAYFGLFSLFPLMLLTLAAAGRVLGSESQAAEGLLELVSVYLPGALQTVRSFLNTLVNSHGLLNGLAIFGLLWAGSQIVFYLEQAMDLAWDCQHRPWWKSRLRSILFLVLAQALVAGYLLLSLASWAQMVIGKLPGYEWLSQEFLLSTSLWLTSLALSVLVFVLMNRFLPNCQVSWRAALFGGLVSATLLELARLAFTYYLRNFAAYNLLYGSIGGLLVLIMWSYYAALVVLVGAELASEFEDVFFGTPRCQKRQPGEAETALRAVGIDADFGSNP